MLIKHSDYRYTRGYCTVGELLMVNHYLQYIQEDYDAWKEIATKRRTIHSHGTGYLRDYKVYFVLADALGTALQSHHVFHNQCT
jgi:hypothetical protein